MKLDVLEDIDDPASRRRLALATFGVEREGVDSIFSHPATDLALEERLDEECQIVDRQERHHSVHTLEEDRRHLELRLELRESFLDLRLPADVNAVGVLRLLEAMRHFAPTARFYQASTSEMFDNSHKDGQNNSHRNFWDIP